MDLRKLQGEQRSWVLHNFPQQLDDVTLSDISDLVFEAGEGNSLQFIADAINDGDPRVVKRKHHGALGMAEELGELMHAFLKHEQGIRKGVDPDQWREEAGDAMADIIIFMCSFCNTHGFDLQSEVEKAWAEVRERDWQRYPGDGKTT